MALVLHLLDVERAIAATLLFEYMSIGEDPSDGEYPKLERVAFAKSTLQEAWNAKSVAYTRQALISAGTGRMTALLDHYAREGEV